MTTLTVATWNVLADAYLGRDAHPDTEAWLLVTGARAPRISDHVTRFMEVLGVEVVCLQEVDALLADHLRLRAARYGYDIVWAPRGRSAPDGCLALVRLPWAQTATEIRAYRSAPDHLAQRVELRRGTSRLVLFNTHLAWADDGGYKTRHQSAELAEWVASEADPTIVVGDLNANPDSETLKHLLSVGCVNLHADPGWRTASFPAAGALRLDHILVRGAVGHPVPIPDLVIECARPLPDALLPSDHAPLAARVDI